MEAVAGAHVRDRQLVLPDGGPRVLGHRGDVPGVLPACGASTRERQAASASSTSSSSPPADDAVRKANRALDEDVRVPYGKLKETYDKQFDDNRPAMIEIWKRDYAPHLVRQTLSMLLSELHEASVVSDKEFLQLTKELQTGSEAKKALLAKHPETAIRVWISPCARGQVRGSEAGPSAMAVLGSEHPVLQPVAPLPERGSTALLTLAADTLGDVVENCGSV